MSSVGYSVDASAPVSLTANTPRTALMVITPSSFGCALRSVTIGFDGVSASALPVTWEVVRSTNATNSNPGTGNTNESSNIVQYKGQTITTGFTAFSASTSEPTVLTTLMSNTLTPAGGLFVYPFPLGDEIECGVNAGLGVRLTVASGEATVNATVTLSFERI